MADERVPDLPIGDLEVALARAGKWLGRRARFRVMQIRAIDPGGGRLQTVGEVPNADHPQGARIDVTSPDRGILLQWLVTGETRIADSAESDPVLRLVVVPSSSAPALAIPLLAAREPIGLLILVGWPGQPLGDSTVRAVGKLAVPLGAALERARLIQEISQLKEAVLAGQRAALQPQDISEAIVGAETGLRGVMERVELVARTDAPVLILGETGSGKEVVARAIHARSRRATGPVLRVNCGAIPGDLVDTQLFGHERGSFTGAVAGRKGWFERADGGTLFLDEIAELPLAAQVRLLRIVQDGTFERVGGQRTLSVDVRMVAATHRDLRAMVREGRFREDLWYRISVFPITLPPLRERREDIPALAAHFSRRAAMRLGASPLLPSPGDLKLLLAYDWPGNARELAAVIERAAILGNGRRLELATALGPGDPLARATTFPNEPSGASEPLAHAAFPTLDEAMASHIEAALIRTRGRLDGPFGAAAALAINPHTLRGRMRKLGIDPRRFRIRADSVS